MKSIAGMAAAFAAAFILQAGFAGFFPVMGASANLLLCLTAVFTFSFPDRYTAVICAGVFGLLYDMCFSQFIGVTGLCLMVICGLCIFARALLLNNETIVSGIVVSVGSVLIYYHLYWTLLKFCGDTHAYIMMLQHLPAYLVINFVIMMIMFLIILRSRRQEDNIRSSRRWE